MPGEYENVSFATLHDVLSFAKENGLHVQVELKGHKDDLDFEKNVLQVIYDCDMKNDVMIITQDYNRLIKVDESDHDILKAFCIVFGKGELDTIEHSDNISLEESSITPYIVHKLHERGAKVFT